MCIPPCDPTNRTGFPPRFTTLNRPSSRPEFSRGFSLVEVVMALGILAFVVTALVGTLVVSMNANKESVEELEATHILQTQLAERRARPILVDSNLLLPPLDTASSRNSADPVRLDAIGHPVATTEEGKFGMVYRIAPTSGTLSADVYCAIYWPGQGKPENAEGRIEMATEILLPQP